MDNMLATTFFGLAAAFCWGSGDFTGGLASRRSNIFSVLIGGWTVGFVVLVSFALLWREPVPSPLDMLWGILAGLVGALGVVALYSALSLGPMGIVAPIAGALNAAVPAIFSALTQMMPGPLRLSGFVLALLAITLVSRPERARKRPRGIWLAMLAGGCFGCYLILLSQMSNTRTFWPQAVTFLTSTLLLLVIALFRRRPLLPERRVVPQVILGGMLTSLGNIFFLWSEHAGQLAIASVLSSLYPAATVLLATFVLRERVNRLQAVGMALALAAIGLISA